MRCVASALVTSLNLCRLMKILQVLHTLRVGEGVLEAQYFNCKPLDQILQRALEGRRPAAKDIPRIPIVEICSMHPGGGATHLLYYMCAQAVLPVQHGGKQACTVIVDADGAFSVARLASQLASLVPQTLEVDEATLQTTVSTALKHVHVFHPQTLAGAIATMDSLPAYLFDQQRHWSSDRQVGFVALDTASAFYWQDRAEVEDAAFQSTTMAGETAASTPGPSGYNTLASCLKAASRTFNCPIIVTSWHLGTTPVTHQQQQYASGIRSFRSTFSGAFAQLPALRFVIRRAPVSKFPVGITVTNALREAGDRQKVVDEGRFECFVNEWGMEERGLSGVGRSGFAFIIGAEGVMLEEI